MTRTFIVSGVALACAALVTVTVSAQRGGGGGGGRGGADAAAVPAPSGPNYPAWAYAITPPGAPAAAPEPADTSVHHVAGTDRGFTVAQIADIRGPADWFPEDHPAMPPIVAVGRQPQVRSCSYCHYPNGEGRPSNGGVAGLPVAYILNTLNDFKTGVRKPGDPRKVNVNQMITFAKNLTPEEARSAAEYFSSTPWTQWVKVVETKMVPKTEAEGSIFFKSKEGGMEPIGMRVIETPEQDEQTEPLRNPRSGFIAYVPVGAVKKGEALVTTGGNGKTVACTLCHGADLRGLGPVPGIAGRSPSYLARQLYDIQVGARHGEWAELMKPVVAKLTNEDMVDITAYVSGRPMPAAPGSKATN